MDVAAAVALAAAHRIRTVVPMHFDLYSNNGLTAAELNRLWNQQPGASAVTMKTLTPAEYLKATSLGG